MYKKYFKRMFDIICSIILIVIISPVFVITFLLVIIFLGKPVIFKQERPGLNEDKFIIYKFRTMNSKRDDSGLLLPDEKRLTRFGKTVRKLSLDEIPQLFNVLKGDMSFVGPRPLLSEYLSLYNEEQRKRHIVRPGITGWAQINGRNSISWEEKFELDCYYAENVDFFIDLKIIWLTTIKVLKSSDVSSDTYVTMEKFTGGK